MSLPKFFITPFPNLDGASAVFGTPEAPLPVQDGWLQDRRDVYLKSGSQLYRGRWQRRPCDWAFVYAPWCRARLPAGETEVEYVGEAWGQRATLALDPTVEWTPRKFRVSRRQNRRPCGFCQTSVSPQNPDHHWTLPNFVACDACYEAYVEQRSLGFLPGVAGTAETRPTVAAYSEITILNFDSPRSHSRIHA